MQQIWVWTGPTNSEARKHLMKVSVDAVIVPAAIAKRRAIALRNLHPPWSKTTTPPTNAELEAEIKRLRILLTVDGEHAHLTALMDFFLQLPHDLHIDVIKFAASCSKTQQPCDVSSCFRVFKQLLSALLHSPSAVTPFYMHHLETVVLRDIDAASRRAFLNFFSHIPDLMSRAFTVHNVTQGFAISGMYPYNPTNILRQCTTFDKLSGAEAKAAFAAINPLSTTVDENGQLTEPSLVTAGGALLNDARLRLLAHVTVTTKKGIKAALHLRKINHRRALHLNHVNIMQAQTAVAAKGAKKQGVKQPKVSEMYSN